MLRTHRFTTTTAAAIAIALSAAAPAIAQDLRTPDAVDAASKPKGTQAQDLRTPDAIDASRPRTPTTDLRSPDAIDAANPQTAPSPERVRIVEVPATGFAWGDAGIGAAAMLALVLVGMGVAMAGLHRRGRRLPAPAR
jgi:hypothetical protein